MDPIRVTSPEDKAAIEAFLRRDPLLHIYEIGDLDDFFWPHTTWYAGGRADRIEDLVLLYTGADLPVLIALGREPLDGVRRLLREIAPRLPRRVYAHLSGDLWEAFAKHHRITSRGIHLRMALMERGRLDPVDVAPAVRLSGEDLPDLDALYAAAYRGNWFVPRMLETGAYFGIRREGKLVSVAGVHVYSAAYRVAALGNIATHPAHRGQGLGTAVTAALCRFLLATVEWIGLNVREDNASAIACYERLGFRRVAAYGEFLLESP